MTNFGMGTHVLVEFNGVDVPGIVSDYENDNFVDVDFGNIGVIGVDREFVRYDPAYRTFNVGDVVENSDELKRLKDRTVLLDVDGDAIQIDDDHITGTMQAALDLDSEYVCYPLTILWIPND